MGMLRKVDEEQSFYDDQKGEWVTHCADDLVMCLGDISGHMGRHING